MGVSHNEVLQTEITKQTLFFTFFWCKIFRLTFLLQIHLMKSIETTVCECSCFPPSCSLYLSLTHTHTLFVRDFIVLSIFVTFYIKLHYIIVVIVLLCYCKLLSFSNLSLVVSLRLLIFKLFFSCLLLPTRASVFCDVRKEETALMA